MPQTFTGSIKFALAGMFSGDNDLSSVSQAFNYTQNYNLTNGTGIDQANMIWADQRTISASGVDNLDLYGGLSNAFGSTINFTSIKGIIIVAASTNTNDVLIGGDDSAAFVGWVGASTDTIVVKPGGMFALVNPASNGYTVTNTTADVLQIANSSSGSSVVYDIILLGEV
jgi:hypothetical protein